MGRVRFPKSEEEAPRAKRKKKRLSGIPEVQGKLHPKVLRQFVALISEHGAPPDLACDYLGIQPTTFWKWVRLGEAYIIAGQTPRENELFGAFYLAFRKATAEYRLDNLKKLNEGAKNWTCWMTILERRDRANFSKFDQAGSDLEDFDPDERFL